MIYIGIDPGVKTGFATWDAYNKEFLEIETLKIHEAFDIIQEYKACYSIYVIVEDARQRKWYGNNSRDKQQGAGSVKRDCKIWEDFLKDNKISFEMIHPKKGFTKLNKIQFENITGWKRRTSEHSRDAGMLVYKRKENIILD